MTGNYTTLVVDFIMDRYYNFYIVRMYLPAGMGTVISFMPFWLGRKNHFSRISIGLTTVFTMASLIAQTSSRLPVVSYLTALDVYLYICYTVVTASLIEYTVACYCESKSGTAGSSVEKRRKSTKSFACGGQLMSRFRGRHRRCRLINSSSSANFVTAQCVSADNGVAVESGELRKSSLTESNAKHIDLISKILFPVVFSIFNIVYIAVMVFIVEGYSNDKLEPI